MRSMSVGPRAGRVPAALRGHTRLSSAVARKVLGLGAAILLGSNPLLTGLIVRNVEAASPSFVTRQGQQLTLDGQPFRFTGMNIYAANSDGWCGEDYTANQLRTAFDGIGSQNTVLRAWFFQTMAAQKGPDGSWTGVRDWSHFDQTLAVAAEKGVHVIVTLTDQWGECGDGGASGYKTKDWYLGGYNLPDPILAAKYAQWASYRDWVTEVVTRYKDNPTILAWQLVNEAEVKDSLNAGCPVGDPNDPLDHGNILRDFAQDISGLIRGIDANHLISLGTLGGGQCGTQDWQYSLIHALPNIDFCEVHDYSLVTMPGDPYNGLQRHLDQCAVLNKPLFIGETGITPNDLADKSFDGRAQLFDAKFRAQFAAGVVGELVWDYRRTGSTLATFDIGGGDPTLLRVRAWSTATENAVWTAAPSMSANRAGATATRLADGRILVAGGQGGAPGRADILRSVELYDPATNKWAPAADMSVPRALHQATLLADGRVFVAGGTTSSPGNVLSSAEIYDPITDSWSAAASMPDAGRYSFTMTTLASGKILITGGSTYISSAAVYDPASDSWAVAGNMSTDRRGHTASLLTDGRVLIVGGFSQSQVGTPGAFSATADVYDPTTNGWSTAGSIGGGRYGQTASVMLDGRVIVAGGYGPDPICCQNIANTRIYDPVGGTWTVGPTMTSPRYGFTTTTLLDDRILVAGGHLNTAEIFDPTSGAWSATAGMLADHESFATATLLADGRVLVAGGTDHSSGGAIAAAEIFDPSASPPPTAPAAPTSATAVAGNGQATVSWLPPASDGGSPITGFKITAAPGGATATGAASSTSATVSGLTNGTTYTFTVTASNVVGAGPASAPSNAVTPATSPGAATSVSAAAGSTSASASWLPPASDGGSPITGYTITAAPGGATATAAAGSTSATITGLFNGTPYTFTVTATNAVGTGPASDPSAPVTPQSGAPAPQTTSASVPPSGGTATTDPTNSGPTPSDPITTSVTVPPGTAGGTLTIAETAVTQPAPSGYQSVGQQIDITSTAATSASNPLTIVFTLDSSAIRNTFALGPSDPLPAPEQVVITRTETGSPVPIPACTASAPPIAPDPCVSDRQYVNSGDDLRITILTGSASHWNSVVQPIAVSVANSGYSPPTVTVAQGGIVLWTFGGTKSHSVTENLKLGPAKAPLFTSGVLSSGRYGYVFRAAATYTYGSTVKGDPGSFAGAVAVPVRVTPTTGGTATSFTVTWSSSTLTGYVFDVQYRFMKAGTKSWSPLKVWKTGVSVASGTFSATSGAGTYAFSARFRNSSTAISALWSPETTFIVR